MGLVGLALAALLLFAGRADAATRTWDGGCGASEKAWSCDANWSENTVPGPTDKAVFNSTSSHDSTVDAGFLGQVASLQIGKGYGGTLSLARGLIVTATLNQAGGAFSAGGQPLTLRGLTLSGGSFTASSDTTSISGNLKISGSSTFHASGGTVDFDGGSGMLSCHGVAFNRVEISNMTGTKKVGSECDLPLGSDPAVGGGGSVSLSGTLSGSGTLAATATLTLGTGSHLSSTFSGLETGSLTVKGNYHFGEYEPFAVNGNFSLAAGGSLEAPEGVASFAKNFTVSASSGFDANEGEIEFDNDSHTTAKLSCGGMTFSDVSFASSAAKKTIGSDCTLPLLGEDPSLGDGGTVLKGSLWGEGNGDLTESGTFKVESVSPGLQYFTDVDVDGAFTASASAVLVAPPGTFTVTGNFMIANGESFNANGGTIDFHALPVNPTPTFAKTIHCGGAEFNSVVFTNTIKEIVYSGCKLPLGSGPSIGVGGISLSGGTLAGSGTLKAGDAPVVLGTDEGLSSGFSGLETGALTIKGTYDFSEYEHFAVGGDFALGEEASVVAPEGTASFEGDFGNSGGTFEAGEESTVKLTGINQQITGSTTFNNLEKVVESAATLTFEAGATQVVEGLLKLEDTGGGKLHLVSSSPGSPWLIEANGTAEVQDVSVADSENTGTTTIEAFGSVSESSNPGWEFL